MQGKAKRKECSVFFFQLQIEMASGKVIIDKEALESDAKLRTCRLLFYFSFLIALRVSWLFLLPCRHGCFSIA